MRNRTLQSSDCRRICVPTYWDTFLAWNWKIQDSPQRSLAGETGHYNRPSIYISPLVSDRRRSLRMKNNCVSREIPGAHSKGQDESRAPSPRAATLSDRNPCGPGKRRALLPQGAYRNYHIDTGSALPSREDSALSMLSTSLFSFGPAPCDPPISTIEFSV